MRQIDLGLDFVAFGARSTRRLGCALRFRSCKEMRTHLLGFMLLDRAGVRLLLGYSDNQQHIENGFAFDFQLPGQIVNSNLTHPPSVSSAYPVKPS
jgi:hypothetical protein